MERCSIPANTAPPFAATTSASALASTSLLQVSAPQIAEFKLKSKSSDIDNTNNASKSCETFNSFENRNSEEKQVHVHYSNNINSISNNTSNLTSYSSDVDGAPSKLSPSSTYTGATTPAATDIDDKVFKNSLLLFYNFSFTSSTPTVENNEALSSSVPYYREFLVLDGRTRTLPPDHLYSRVAMVTNRISYIIHMHSPTIFFGFLI